MNWKKEKRNFKDKFVNTKLSLKGVNKEIEACKEAMNNQTKFNEI